MRLTHQWCLLPGLRELMGLHPTLANVSGRWGALSFSLHGTRTFLQGMVQHGDPLGRVKDPPHTQGTFYHLLKLLSFYSVGGEQTGAAVLSETLRKDRSPFLVPGNVTVQEIPSQALGIPESNHNSAMVVQRLLDATPFPP